jgi:hypothetical protein
MARCKMIPRAARVLLAEILLIGGVSVVVAVPLVARPPIEADVDPGVAKSPPHVNAPSDPLPAARAQVRNPLWAIPLKQLTVTRERPIFSPSRRPPPPAVDNASYVAPVVTRPPKPAEPERPQLSLVGTVASEREGIGVFVEQTTKNIVRLKTGEAHQGWILRAVQGREATFEKDRETAILALPPPGGEPTGGVALPPSSGLLAGSIAPLSEGKEKR